MISVQAYVIVGALLFGLGVTGFLARRNLIVIFLSTEMMFQGALLNFVAMSGLHRNLDGQIFALFLLVIAAVEAGVALALVVVMYRLKGSLDATAWRSMRG